MPYVQYLFGQASMKIRLILKICVKIYDSKITLIDKAELFTVRLQIVFQSCF
jgi:hypothetical protein